MSRTPTLAPAPDPTGETGDTLQRAARGDAQAWAELVRAYTPRVYGLVLKNTGDPELAEEMTQATFVTLVQKLDRFAGYEERGRFEPWLFKVAMNKLRDEKRRQARQAKTMDMSPAANANTEQAQGWAAAEQQVVMGGPSASADPLDQLDHADQVARMKQAVKQLPEQDQELLYLRHTAGLSFAQIAESLEQPLGTVLARGHRAVKKLRKLLEDELDNPIAATA